jgi:creatinine amidohydrolase
MYGGGAMARAGVFLSDLTWAEAGERLAAGAAVLIPVGAAAKEHGLHLPLDTDARVVRELAARAAARLPLLVAPVVGFGYYPAFAAYPGSQHLRADTFGAIAAELAGNFIDHGARKIAVLNNGVSTEAPLADAARRIVEARGVELLILNTRVLGRGADRLLQQSAGGHADERETSVMLAIAPETVRLERARPAYRPAGATLPFNLDPASPGYNPTGATGDPTLATAEKGRAILAEMEREIAEALRERWPELASG